MFNNTSNNDLDTKKVQENTCIVCLDSFALYDQRAPYQCTEKKCGRNFCGRCIVTIKKCNGPDRPFQCMFCLFKYPLNSTPVKNASLLKQLWVKAYIKYGFQESNIPTSTIMSQRDFQFELECRSYHMTHLFRTLEQFNDWNQVESALRTRNDAHGMMNQLVNIHNQVKNNATADISSWQREYIRVITLPNHSQGSFYIDICERLSLEIVEAELRQLFPETNARCIQWTRTLGSGDEFEPKINVLMNNIQSDICALSSNIYHTTLRTRIGFIGYTSSGKTTLMCRILGIDEYQRDQFFPVRTTKSTYYPLQYDRMNPLIHPKNSNITTPVKLIDIQGCDQGQHIFSNSFEAGNYLDEIKKADCDIYVLVFNNNLTHEQHQWIAFIEQLMQRQCILVRSKVDEMFLNKFFEQCNVSYGMSSEEERTQCSPSIIADLRHDFQVVGYQIFLTNANYRPNNLDAKLLMQNQSFDFNLLLDELSRRAPTTQNIRLRNLAVRAVQRVINSCFRCGYVLNVMKYKITTGILAIIPFADVLPRHAAQKDIKEAFGITIDFLETLTQRNLEVLDGQLQTSVFKAHVNISTGIGPPVHNNLLTSAHTVVAISGGAAALADDIARVGVSALPALSNATRLALAVATFGVGLAISAGVCAWSAHNTGQHIFSFVNQLSDDLIIVSIPLIESFMQQRPSAPII